MRSKTFFVLLIIAVAYVLGARAGRERYDHIIESVRSFWNDPTVAKARKDAKKQAEKARKRYA